MPLSAERRSLRLEKARALYDGREFASVARLLGDVARADLLAEPELGYLLAYAWRRVGRTGPALALARALADPCRRRGRDRLWRRRLNLEGMLRFDLGQLDRARLRWAELARAASDAGDDGLAATANNNLGIIATLEGRQDEALGCYGRALAAYQRLGDRRGLAETHQNLAITYRELGFVREAESHFSDASAHADDAEDIIGRVEQERAVTLILAGDTRLASALARWALSRFQAIQDRAAAADALRVLGLVALRSGDIAEARARLDRALAEARATGAALTEAETLEALAALELRHGHPDSAAARRDAAERLFRGMGAESWGRQVRARLLVMVGREG